jgi:hypothetical protein
MLKRALLKKHRWSASHDITRPLLDTNSQERERIISHRIVPLGSALRGMIVVLLLALGSSLSCKADVVLFHTQRTDSTEEELIRRVVGFYGLNIRIVDVTLSNTRRRAISELRSRRTLAVLISQEALQRLDRKSVQAALRETKGSPVPVLVFGVKDGGAPGELNSWSGGAIRDCLPLQKVYIPKVLQVGKEHALAGPLTGWQLPAVAAPACRLDFEPTSTTQTVLSTSGTDGTPGAGVLIRHKDPIDETFFVPRMNLVDCSRIGRRNALSEAFSSMAPYMFFFSYAAGDHAWHFDGHYANLTIDDAWLTQPFGNLDYKGVLAEMESHNFHTTIAFIPWNFDRSDSDLVMLFRQYPDRFSVCIHGNNHTHQEFGDYAKNPLAQQIADIRQGIARMERFRALTGIPYDRFMVFPHAVAPQPTFRALRRYGFLGTANLWNVPSGERFPNDSTFLLRPCTTAYEGLLSLSRYAAGGDVPRLELVIQSFLGNPLLFYGHESLFEKGAGSFNVYADFVNRIERETRWISLGEIARHSHLLRQRMDGDFDVRMLSSEMDLGNPIGKDRKFYIQWARNSSPDIVSLTVDGYPATFEHSADGLLLQLIVPAHQIRKVRVAYLNDLDLSREDVRKRSLYAYALRTISDFRDLHLSRSSWGKAITRSYYGHHRDELELYLEQKWWVGLIWVGLILVAIRYCRRHRTTVRMKQRPTTHSGNPA